MEVSHILVCLSALISIDGDMLISKTLSSEAQNRMEYEDSIFVGWDWSGYSGRRRDLYCCLSFIDRIFSESSPLQVVEIVKPYRC